jgi:phage recombination protein Bet
MCMSTPARTAESPHLVHGFTPQEVDLIRRTIAPDATEHELALYLRLCQTYGLDPFRRELVMVKRRRRKPSGDYEVTPVFITTRDGYLKIAQRDPGYAGIESAVVCEADHFEFDVGNHTIVHRFPAKERGKIIGAWAVAYHKSRPPVMAFVTFEEYYDPDSETWKTHPSAMIQKVAEVFVLRRQFGITGIVAQEEMTRDLSTPATEVVDAEPVQAADNKQPRTAPANGPAKALPSPTDFWKAVRAAAPGDPIAWVRERTGGETNINRLPREVVLKIYQEALAATKPCRKTSSNHNREDVPAQDSREKKALLAAIQAVWRASKATPEEQAAQVRAISDNRTAVPAELTVQELSALLSAITEETSNAHPATAD